MIGMKQFCNSQIARHRRPSWAAPVLECAEHRLPIPSIWHSARVDNLSRAQDMLDRLENAGRAERKFRILGEKEFEVSWK